MVIGMTVSHYYLQNNLPKNPAECFCMYHINIQIELLEILIAFPRSKIQNYIHRSKLLILEICKYLHNQEKKQHWTGNEVVSFSNSRFVNCLVISIVHFPKENLLDAECFHLPEFLKTDTSKNGSKKFWYYQTD